MRALSEAWEGMVRFPGRTAASVLAIAMALVLFGVFGLLTVCSHGLLDLLRKGEEINVYLTDDLNDAGMLELDLSVSKLPGVAFTRIVSKEDAAAEFKRMFGEDLLAALEENPLPRSILITVAPNYRNAAGFESISKHLFGSPGVESVEYGREWLAKMDVVFILILTVEAVLGSLVCIAGLIVIANTIGMNVVIRREAIEIMRLVGATERYIRRPFYLEGTMQGGMAGMVALAILYFPYFWAQYSFTGFEVFLHTFGLSKNALETAGIYLSLLIPAGALLGLLGSHIAVRRTT